MKRKLKWLAVVLAVSLLGFGTPIFLWPRDRITAESLTRIHAGMTEKEVEHILGGPGKKPPFTSDTSTEVLIVEADVTGTVSVR